MPHSLTTRFLRVFLGLLTLTTFAIAQSVYQAVVGNPEFVQLNRVTHGDLLLIVLVFNVVPAAFFALLWAFIQHWNGRFAAGFLSLSFFLLLAPFLFELHKRYVSPLTHFHHNTILILVPLAVAAAIVFRYRSEFERFLLVLSPVVVLFPALFLWRAWREVSPVVAPPAATMQAGAATAKAGPPVFILVLDEFTRTALLDSSGNYRCFAISEFRQAGAGEHMVRQCNGQRRSYDSRHSGDRDRRTFRKVTIRRMPRILTISFACSHPSTTLPSMRTRRASAPAPNITAPMQHA